MRLDKDDILLIASYQNAFLLSYPIFNGFKAEVDPDLDLQLLKKKRLKMWSGQSCSRIEHPWRKCTGELVLYLQQCPRADVIT